MLFDLDVLEVNQSIDKVHFYIYKLVALGPTLRYLLILYARSFYFLSYRLLPTATIVVRNASSYVQFVRCGPAIDLDSVLESTRRVKRKFNERFNQSGNFCKNIICCCCKFRVQL